MEKLSKLRNILLLGIILIIASLFLHFFLHYQEDIYFKIKYQINFAMPFYMGLSLLYLLIVNYLFYRIVSTYYFMRNEIIVRIKYKSFIWIIIKQLCLFIIGYLLLNTAIDYGLYQSFHPFMILDVGIIAIVNIMMIIIVKRFDVMLISSTFIQWIIRMTIIYLIFC